MWSAGGWQPGQVGQHERAHQPHRRRRRPRARTHRRHRRSRRRCGSATGSPRKSAASRSPARRGRARTSRARAQGRDRRWRAAAVTIHQAGFRIRRGKRDQRDGWQEGLSHAKDNDVSPVADTFGGPHVICLAGGRQLFPRGGGDGELAGAQRVHRAHRRRLSRGPAALGWAGHAATRPGAKMAPGVDIRFLQVAGDWHLSNLKPHVLRQVAASFIRTSPAFGISTWTSC